MSNKSNMFWTIYKKLEKDVLDLSYYIHFSDEEIRDRDNLVRSNQIWTYSNQIADLLIAISTQVESLFLELYKTAIGTNPKSIGNAINKLDCRWNLSEKKVRIISKNMYFTDKKGFGNQFAPMAYQSGDENDYYSSYCAVKHDRINTLHKANINVLVRALAALFVLNVYFSFDSEETNKISDFDFSMGSDVFIVKYSVNDYSSDDVLIVSEDVDYLKKVDAFADVLCHFEDSELLKYADETPEPQRYTIRINK